MMDDQWCLDECPTCATVVHGSSVYCSPKCEPFVEREPELEELSYPSWTQRNNARVSAWAYDCYQSNTPSNAPIFPSPSRRKLFLRKQHPTSWLAHDAPLGIKPALSVSSPLSTGGALESLALVSASSPATPSPIARYLPRSWAPAPTPPSRPRLTKTNISFMSSAESTALATTPASASASGTTSEGRPVTPSDLSLWMSTTLTIAGSARSKSEMVKGPPLRPATRSGGVRV